MYGIFLTLSASCEEGGYDPFGIIENWMTLSASCDVEPVYSYDTCCHLQYCMTLSES
jgi:hypothetical protein